MEGQAQDSHFMMPFALGATTLLGGSSFLELVTHGAIRSPDNAAPLYLAIMAAYAGAGEVKGWMHKRNPAEAEAISPWLERARKGGIFVSFWLILYASAYLLRLWDPSYPMPHELKTIALEIVSLFFVTYSARSLRRSRYGASDTGANDADAAAFQDQILRYLQTQADGAAPRDILAQFPDVPRRTLNRALAELVSGKKLSREGSALSPAVRYCLPKTR